MFKKVRSLGLRFRSFIILGVLSVILFGLLAQGQDRKVKDLSSSRVLGVVSYYVSERYVEKERIDTTRMAKEAMAQLERSLAEVLVDYSESPPELIVTVGGATKRFNIAGLSERKRDFGRLQRLLGEMLAFVQSNLPTDDNSDREPRDVLYAAINGMLSTLDPHSQLLVPKVFKEFRIKTEGKFGGLGMVVTIKEDGFLTVIAPLPNTPAWRAKLKPRDKILEIDQQSTINMSLQEAVSKLRGDPGTDVTISVMSEGDTQAREVTITREIIEPPSAPQAEVLDGGIGYIKLTNFQGNTIQHLQRALDGLKEEGNGAIKGLILDLRDNPGGLLDQAVKVADKFLKKGVIVKESVPYKRERVDVATEEGAFADWPMVVLINGGSASGSEIVAGALKENDRAVLIGGRTFGKGTIQELCNCGDGSALKITVGEYLTPGDVSIQEVAIMPDISLVPALVTKKSVSLFATDFYTREEDLRFHFKHDEEIAATEDQRTSTSHSPSQTVRYLFSKEEADEDVEARTPYGKHDLSTDFHVQFARRLLANAASNKKSEILASSKPLVEQIAAEEEDKIVTALAEMGIDWSKGESSIQQQTPGAAAEKDGRPDPIATLSIDKPGAKVKAGDEITLTLTVANKGKGTMYRTVGIIDSKSALFNKREFPLGKIGPGEEKSYSVKIEIPPASYDREEIITVKFKELNGNAPKDINSAVRIEALPRPQFAYAYQIDDSPPTYRGNGDGLIQRGEEVGLLLYIKNVGRGKSEKNVVTLRDLTSEEVYVKEGRAQIGDLAPGEAKVVPLRLDIRRSLSKERFNFKVIIKDSTFSEYLSDKLAFDVESAPPGRMTPTSKRVRVVRDAIPIRGGASAKSPIIARAKKGAALLCDAILRRGVLMGAEDATDKLWHRVILPNDRWGWILLPARGGATGVVEVEGGEDEGTTEMGENARPSGSSDGVEFLVQQAPPVIELDGRSLYPVQNGKTVKISGWVRDDHRVKNVYVFVKNDAVNYDKIYLKSASAANDATRLSFSTDVPLDEGVNLISVGARDDRGLFASKSFFVTRRPRTSGASAAE